MGFVFYNPNPDDKYVGDCVVRAISKILSIDWEEAYLCLAAMGLVLRDMPSSDDVWGELMANKTMHHVIIGADTYEIVDQTARQTDATLTQSGMAADAKAVGDAVANIEPVEIYVDGTSLVINTNLTDGNEVSY